MTADPGGRSRPLSVSEASEVLRAGGLVAFPTETVYGLGARAFDASAVAKVFERKARPSCNPLIVHVASVAMAREATSAWPEAADALAAEFWPGPVTLVLPAHERLPSSVTAGGRTVGVRMPNHPLALELIRTLGEPIVGPSANRSGRLSPTRAEHVRSEFRGLSVLDGGPCATGVESTVVRVDDDGLAVLRPGGVGGSELAKVTGLGVRPARPEPSASIAQSPGVVGPHYRPSAALHVAPRSTLLTTARHAQSAGMRIAVIVRTGGRIDLPGTPLLLPAEPSGYARELYATLRDADAQNPELMLLEAPAYEPSDSTPDPRERSLLEALRERLTRAATRYET